jgi:hypothetical protein
MCLDMRVLKGVLTTRSKGGAPRMRLVLRVQEKNTEPGGTALPTPVFTPFLLARRGGPLPVRYPKNVQERRVTD